MTRFILCLSFCLVSFFAFAREPAPQREPATFYLDSEKGDDTNSGQSTESAWKTIARLRMEQIVPGDTVLFRRGGLWRESLKPASGEPGHVVTYDAYGEGEKPILQASTARDQTDDWKRCAEKNNENLWETGGAEPIRGEKISVDFFASWYVHQEKPAEVKLENQKENGVNTLRLTVKTKGDASSRIQMIGPRISDGGGDDGGRNGVQNAAILKFRARCTKTFKIPSISVRNPNAPWNNFLYVIEPATITPDWREFDVFLPLVAPAPEGQLVFYVGGAVPDDSVFELQPLSMHAASYPPDYEPLSADVGNIIFDHGKRVGFKRWNLGELNATGDFWHDTENGRVLLYAERNPAELYRSIELCLKRNVVDHGNVHDCVIRNLALRYSAAHGVGGMGARRVVIEDCDVYYIGGGHLYTRNGKPTRYGNGIEWWDDAEDCLVQRCRLWEIYDVAFSPQGNRENKKFKNITIRDCTIWNCEQSFEYWRTGEVAETVNVVFEHNTCVDGGFGWSHQQRPDKRGTHFLSYNVTIPSDVILRNNIFCRGENDLISMFTDWRDGMRLHNNLWWQPSGKNFLSFQGKGVFKTEEFQKYLDEYGIEKNSVLAEPIFVDPVSRDYRLAPDSPGRNAATDGGPVGRRQFSCVP